MGHLARVWTEVSSWVQACDGEEHKDITDRIIHRRPLQESSNCQASSSILSTSSKISMHRAHMKPYLTSLEYGWGCCCCRLLRHSGLWCEWAGPLLTVTEAPRTSCWSRLRCFLCASFDDTQPAREKVGQWNAASLCQLAKNTQKWISHNNNKDI